MAVIATSISAELKKEFENICVNKKTNIYKELQLFAKKYVEENQDYLKDIVDE